MTSRTSRPARPRVVHAEYGLGEVQSWQRGGRIALVLFDGWALPVGMPTTELLAVPGDDGEDGSPLGAVPAASKARPKAAKADAEAKPHAPKPSAEDKAPEPSAETGPPKAPAKRAAPSGSALAAAPAVVGTYEAHVATRTLEAMRLGVVPHDDVTAYTVGRDAELARVDADLDEVERVGGGVRAFMADYGVGKTHMLELVQGRALSRGYMVAQAVLDPRETQPSHPKRVFRALVRSMRYPDRLHEEGAGLRPLLDKGVATDAAMDRFGVSDALARLPVRDQLDRGAHLYLTPALAYWRTLDGIASKGARSKAGQVRGVTARDRDVFLERGRDLLLDWLEAHPTVSNQLIDQHLRRLPGAHPKIYSLLDYRPWSRIYGYLLNGLATLARCAGYRGLVVLLDEAEFYALLSRENQEFAKGLLRSWTGAAVSLDDADLPFSADDLGVGGAGIQRDLPTRYDEAPGLYLGLAMTPNPAGIDALEAALPSDRMLTLAALSGGDYAELTRRVCDFYASARSDWTLPEPLVGALQKVVGGLYGSGYIHNPRHAMKFLIEFLDIARHHPTRVGEVVRGLQQQTAF